MIKLVIVDDNKSVLDSLVTKLTLGMDFKIIGTFKNGKEIFHAIAKGLKPDVILMDIEMPEMNGLEATEKILSIEPQMKIIMCTVFDDETNIFNAVCAGAKGYILKDESIDKIRRYIYETVEGGSAMSPEIAIKALNLIKKSNPPQDIPAEKYSLTEREIFILNHIAAGLSYDQIAGGLGISYGTVRKHIENMYRKLNVHNKVEAINKARKGGLL